MAYTKIIPIRNTIGKSVDYICDPTKTDHCAYIYSEKCFPKTAEVEFEFLLRQAQEGGKVIGRHLIQSFAQDEVTPEQAHEIGKKLAEEIFKGEYAFVMATHVDKEHTHNHFIICAVNTKTHKRYRSNKGSYREIRATSDRLCKEYGLSVIEDSPNKGKGYFEYQEDKKGTSYKSKTKNSIDDAILKANNFEEFLKILIEEGYLIKNGKHISFKHPEAERYVRGKTLGELYDEENIRKRIEDENKFRAEAKLKAEEQAKNKKVSPNSSKTSQKTKKVPYTSGIKDPYLPKVENIREMVDLNSEKFKENPALRRWGTRHNIQAMAETTNLLTEKNLWNLNDFDQHLAVAKNTEYKVRHDFLDTQEAIKEQKELLQQAQVFARTKGNQKIFDETKDKHKEKLLRQNPHIETDIILHGTAKRELNAHAKKFGITGFSVNDIKNEIERLENIQELQKNTLYEWQNEIKELETLDRNLSLILEKERKQTQTKNQTKTQQKKRNQEER
ncbi:MAG: relaxase/mobilization nuclease domain-containing protein [Eubacteriales bacterium]